MFQFIGYDFFSGPDALNFAPNVLNEIDTTRLSNAIFNHFNVTHDVKLYGEQSIPTGWTYDTILDANFNNSTSAGNLDYMISQIQGIKIKRRKKGSFEWLTLKYYPITDVESLNFTFNDFLNSYGIEYEYALVPVVGGIEGDYIMNSVLSKFSGVFIGNAEQSFKFLYEVNYSNTTRNQQIGSFMPLGKKYPILVGNGILDYDSGSFSATILNDDFEDSRSVNPTKIVEKVESMKKFLGDKKPKILKDWNGNFWLIMVTSNIQFSYKENFGMRIPQVQFDWTEIGDSENQYDLYDTGMIEVLN